MAQVQNAFIELFNANVKECITNLQGDLSHLITQETLSGTTTYIDRYGVMSPPTDIATAVQPRRSGGIENHDKLTALLTMDSQDFRIRTHISPNTQKNGHWWETEDEFLTNMQQGIIVPRLIAGLKNQRAKKVIDALRANEVTRTTMAGAVVNEELPASQKMTPTAIGGLDYDYIQDVVTKFDQVGATGQICALITPNQRNAFMKDPRFSKNDYAKFVDYGRLDSHKLHDTERVTFIVVPSTSYIMPRTNLNQGALMADTECFFWVKEAIAGGDFYKADYALSREVAFENRLIASLKEFFNCVRVDDAGVVQGAVTV